MRGRIHLLIGVFSHGINIGQVDLESYQAQLTAVASKSTDHWHRVRLRIRARVRVGGSTPGDKHIYIVRVVTDRSIKKQLRIQ